MSTPKRRTYTYEYRLVVCERMVEIFAQDGTVSDVSRETGVSIDALNHWFRRYREGTLADIGGRNRHGLAKRVVELHTQGLYVHQIAKRVKAAPDTVRKLLRQAGIKPPKSSFRAKTSVNLRVRHGWWFEGWEDYESCAVATVDEALAGFDRRGKVFAKGMPEPETWRAA